MTVIAESAESVEKALSRKDVVLEDSNRRGEKGRRVGETRRQGKKLGWMMRLAMWKAERKSDWIVNVEVAISVKFL